MAFNNKNKQTFEKQRRSFPAHQGHVPFRETLFCTGRKKSGRSASRYLRLFEALSNMEEYDEAKLKKKFPKNLSSDKAYLYEAILRSMRDYRSSNSKAAQVKERLMDSKYLYERGLYDQSRGRISEAKAMAKELEDNFTMLEINKEEQVALFDRKAKVKLEHIQQLNEERTQILAAVNEELKYLDLYYRLLLEVFQEFNLKDERSIEELKERIPLELLKEENRPKSPQAVRRFLLCNAVFYNLLGELGKVFEYSLQAALWWDNHQSVKNEEFHRYIINVSNLVNTCYEREKYFQVAEEWQEKLKLERSGQGYHNQRVIFLKLSITNLLHLLNQNDFQRASQLLPEIIAGLNKFGFRKSIVLTGNIATVYFLVDDFENCIHWVDHIVQNLKASGRDDIHRIMRIYRLIAHFEMDDVDQVEADFRSVQRCFKSRGLAKGRFEEVLLNEHLKTIFFSDLGKQREAYKMMYAYLQGIKEKDGDHPLGVDELLIWCKKEIGVAQPAGKW